MSDETPRGRPHYVSPGRYVGDSPLLAVWRESAGFRLRYAEGAEFLLDANASSVEACWDPTLTDQDVVIYLLGPVLGFLLRLRGMVPLHASAVQVDESAIVFLGEAGAGKSTTAAVFASLGYRVLSDDLVRVDVGHGVCAYPSHPRIGIWPDTVEAMFGSADALPRLAPTYSKRYLDLLPARRFQPQPTPIEVIYVLGEGPSLTEQLQVEAMEPKDAMLSLLRHTYCNYLLDARMRATEFDLLGRMVTKIPVRRLRFGGRIEHLPAECRTIVTGRQGALIEL